MNITLFCFISYNYFLHLFSLENVYKREIPIFYSEKYNMLDIFEQIFFICGDKSLLTIVVV